MQLNYIQVT